LHLLGLVSDGGVHSHLDHFAGFLRLARKQGIERVFVHAFLDGRDTPPSSGQGYVARLEALLREEGVGRIATVSGPLLRDGPRPALGAASRGRGARSSSARARRARGRGRGGVVLRPGVTDEFVVPAVIGDAGGPLARVEDGDAILHMNFRRTGRAS
jgi:2,3-bisphosphoglycerate-independent phosphoglycerate mutase